jgi:hypothetical protein
MIPEKYRYDVLARTAAEVDAQPSTYEVAVLLEVLGCFKKDDLENAQFFEISKEVQRLVPFYSHSSTERPTLTSRPPVGRMRALVSGMVYSAVWGIMLIALFAGGISLWAAYPEKVGFISPTIATAVALGVVISFIATGGVQQVFALRMSYYRLQDNFPLARNEAVRGYVIGFLSIAIAAAAFLFFNAVATVFPVELAAYAVMFLVLLGAYRILVIPLYAYRRFHLIAIGLGAALVCLYGVFYWLRQTPIITLDYEVLATRFAGFGVFNVATAVESILQILRSGVNQNVLAAQFAGLGALSVITAIESIHDVLHPKWNQAQGLANPSFYQESAPLRNVRPPRLDLVLFEMLPVFAFGTMFYVFLFFDRLLSWISVRGPFLLTYNANYEFGADIALLILIPLTGTIQYYLLRLSDLLETESSATSVIEKSRLMVRVRRFVVKMFASIGLIACLAVFILWQYADQVVQLARGNQESVMVLRLALLAYSLFAFFLANTFISLSFRRYAVPALLLILATFVELGANTFCPSLISDWNPVYGLLLSIAIVTVIASINTARIIRQAHYSYYSAF